jgi:lipopolysaccharide transport system ATP-binding protein
LLGALRAGKRETRVREVRALEDISFEVCEGERLGIIGRNGAGKTTQLSILASISAPTSGTVEVVGDVHAMLSIGAVLREDLTGRDNIDLDASIHGRSPAEIDAVREQIISFSELSDFIDRPVHTYSSGMKARLAFSMGAFIDPDILIIDETLSVGDFFFSQKASRRMKEIAESGRIVISVTHGLQSAVEMCSRCLWIDRGRIVMNGDPKNVTSAYEASVRQADEADLARKFRQGSGDRDIRSAASVLGGVILVQNNSERQATLTAMCPLEISVAGTLKNAHGRCGLLFSILRVDGRRVWLHKSIEAGLRLPDEGAFKACIILEPFILGADLYRLEVSLADENGTLDTSTRVFEVVDEAGQSGGKPLLLYPPRITVSAIEKVSP